MRCSQVAIDLADGDPSKGNFMFGSPLAVAFAYRGIGRYCLGRAGWRDDLRHGLRPSRSCAPPPTICSARGLLLGWGVAATGVLVETRLDRGAGGDVAEAEAAIERLAAAPSDDGLAVRDILLVRLHALPARAHGDAAAYACFRDSYRDMAGTLDFEGHIALADAMP